MKTNSKNYKAGKKRRNTPAIVLSVILALSIVVNVLSITFGTLYYLKTRPTNNTVEYNATFDYASDYDEIRQELVAGQGLTAKSESDTTFNYDIEFDCYQLDHYQVVYKKLGSFVISDSIMKTYDVGTKKLKYIFFDTEKIKEILGCDKNLHIVTADITTGRNQTEGTVYHQYIFNDMPVTETKIVRKGYRIPAYVGLEFSETKNPDYNYYKIDKLHFTVYLEFLEA